MMPRIDYEIFMRTYSHSDNKLYSYKIDREYVHPFVKVADTRTFLDEFSNINSIGINIDIFPIDGFPDSLEHSKKVLSRIRYYRNFFDLKIIKISKSRNWHKNALLFISQIILNFVSIQNVVKKIDCLSQEYSYDDSKYVGISVWGYGIRERVPQINYQSMTNVNFEGRQFKAIQGYDEYLRCVYGNYMELPPEKKRVSTHRFKAYWL
jgi:lipopolysaccharide cholinephosphotransferase